MMLSKKNLVYVRMIAITLSCLVASMTFLNILTIVTHGIEFEVPEEGDFSFAIDPVEKRLLVLTNFSVKNHGSYDIDEIDINALLVGEDDIPLIDFHEGDMVVTRGSERKFDIMVSVDLDDMDFGTWFKLLYEDTVLKLVLDIDVHYMFRLIHVTVDEVIEYPWKAPLADYLDGGPALSSIGSIIDLAGSELGNNLGMLEREILSKAVEISDFEFSTDDGYNVKVNSTLIAEDVHELACYVRMPVDEHGASLEFSFVLEIGLTPETTWVDIEEVNFNYDKD